MRNLDKDCVVPGTGYFCSGRRSHRGRRPCSIATRLGRVCATALLCAVATLVLSDAALAAKRSKSHAAAPPPTLDAQAVNNAQLAAPSRKGRYLTRKAAFASAPSASSAAVAPIESHSNQLRIR